MLYHAELTVSLTGVDSAQLYKAMCILAIVTGSIGPVELSRLMDECGLEMEWMAVESAVIL